MTYESAVAFGPSDERLRLRSRPLHPRGEVEESGPSARLLDRQPVVVAAAVVNEPAQALRVKPLRAHPLRHRDAVNPRRFRVIRRVRDGNRKRTPPARVAPSGPRVHLFVEELKLARVLFRLP